MRREILVTGGTGFVGRALVDELIRAGRKVIATHHRPVPHDAREAGRPATADFRSGGGGSGAEWIPWDAGEGGLPAVDWERVSGIVHLAAPGKAFDFPGAAPTLFEVGVAATFRLLEVVRVHGIRLVVVSTGDVLGARVVAEEVDGNFEPSSFYGATKACGELLVRAYESTTSACVARLYHPYGPGGERFLVNRLVRRVARGEEIRIEGEHGIRINPVWVDDVARGLRLALESTTRGVFHFAGPDTVTLREFVELTGALLGRPPRLVYTPGAGVERHVGAYERTAQALGWRPFVCLRDGITQLIQAEAQP